MFSNQSADLSLTAACKTVAAVIADKVESRFLVGTSVLNDDNHLHVVRYHSDVNDIGIDATLVHPTGPIQRLCCSPHDRTLVLTLSENYNNNNNSNNVNASNTATLYKIPSSVMEMTNDLQLADDTTTAISANNNDYNYDDVEDSYHDSARISESSISQSGREQNHPKHDSLLETKCTLDASHESSRIVDVVWRGDNHDEDTASPGDVLTLEEQGTVTQWDISLGMAESTKSIAATSSSEDSSRLPAIASPRVVWDPHHGHSFAVSWGRSLRFLDSRSSTVETKIPNAHRYGVADIDYNPNKPHVLATAGYDGLIHFWDIRTTHRPLLTARGGHSHYAWKVQYNPFHDQLVLSTGTDAVVNLWRVSTISSAPLLTLEDDDDPDAPNVRVACHESGDAVYGAAWGAADAWLYMTVAYDGKVALHHVPSKEKYKILL